MAHAGASVDGRNERQKGLNVDVPEEGLGMARLTDCLVPQLPIFSFADSTNEPEIWAAFNNTGRGQKGWHHFLGRTPTIDGTIALVVWRRITPICEHWGRQAVIVY